MSTMVISPGVLAGIVWVVLGIRFASAPFAPPASPLFSHLYYQCSPLPYCLSVFHGLGFGFRAFSLCGQGKVFSPSSHLLSCLPRRSFVACGFVRMIRCGFLLFLRLCFVLAISFRDLLWIPRKIRRGGTKIVSWACSKDFFFVNFRREHNRVQPKK